MVRKNGLPRRVYKKHGAFYYVTLDRKWIRLGKTEAEMYRALAKLSDVNAGIGTMGEYFDRYKKEVIPAKSERTQEDNNREIINLIRAFGHMHPEKIKPKHVYAYMDKRGETSKVRANREKSLLSNVFSYMIRWGVVEVNPCKGVQNFTEKPRDRYVEDWEYWAVYDLASMVMKAAMEITVTTGIRQGDILKLKLSDIKPEGLPVKQSKTGKKQIFEITPALKNAIDMAKSHPRQADSLYIIANEKGQPYTSSGFKSNWQRLMNNAMKRGVIHERFTFHDLRAKAGSDHDNAQRLLGHQSPATTKRVYERKPDKVKPGR